MKCYTGAVSQWRYIREMKIQMVNIARGSMGGKNASPAFAPGLKLLMDYKNGVCDEAEYEKRYRTGMEVSFSKYRQVWNDLMKSDEPIALCCFEPAQAKNAEGEWYRPFCHRYILVEIFKEKCTALGIPFEYLGELVKNPHNVNKT